MTQIKTDTNIADFVQDGWAPVGFFAGYKIYRREEKRILYDAKNEKVIAYYNVEDTKTLNLDNVMVEQGSGI